MGSRGSRPKSRHASSREPPDSSGRSGLPVSVTRAAGNPAPVDRKRDGDAPRQAPRDAIGEAGHARLLVDDEGNAGRPRGQRDRQRDEAARWRIRGRARAGAAARTTGPRPPARARRDRARSASPSSAAACPRRSNGRGCPPPAPAAPRRPRLPIQDTSSPRARRPPRRQAPRSYAARPPARNDHTHPAGPRGRLASPPGEDAASSDETGPGAPDAGACSGSAAAREASGYGSPGELAYVERAVEVAVRSRWARVIALGACRRNPARAMRKGRAARRRPKPAREAYSLYVEPPGEGATYADGPVSSL